MRRITAADLEELGTIVGIWAHPDDELFSMGGLMHAAASRGQRVACVTATRGEKGTSDPAKWPPERLAAVREQELEKAYEILGDIEHCWLDYIDGTCHEVDQTEAVAKVVECIEQYQPDTLITFPPDGLTGHPDHRAVSAWTRTAVQKLGRPIPIHYAVNTKEDYDNYLRAADERHNIFFMVDQPVVIPAAECDLVFELSPKELESKLDALRAQTSQTAGMFAAPDHQWLEKTLVHESFVTADRSDIAWN